MILPNNPIYSKSKITHSTSFNWLYSLSFGVTDTDKKKGSICLDGHERADVVAYREQFCKRWFDRYFPRMGYYEGLEMVETPPELSGHESNILPVFHYESMFNDN